MIVRIALSTEELDFFLNGKQIGNENFISPICVNLFCSRRVKTTFTKLALPREKVLRLTSGV